MKTVALIFTGGTISMKEDEVEKAVLPALTGEEILSRVRDIEKIAQIKPIQFGNYPGPHMTPAKMLELAQLIEKELDEEHIDGVVVTHGTDTLEETAYFLDLRIRSKKPVIVTGAMRNSSELGYDGPANLAASICTAIHPESVGKGVLVVMNDHIYPADEVQKTHTLSLDTFKSLDFGPLGIVDQDTVIYYRNRKVQHKIYGETIEEKVALIKCAVGMTSEYLDYWVEKSYQGIVIEALGRGNVPPGMIEGIQRAVNKSIPVVIVSRCPSGRVLDTYGYEGGGNQLRKMGVLLGENLTGQKARIKLMLVLGITKNMKEIQDLFEEDLYKKR